MIQILGQFAGFILFAAVVAGAAYADHLIKAARFDRHAKTAVRLGNSHNTIRMP